MSNDWDVDSYKTEHETEEHWELRKNFMLAHKDKFPEDELVCLAQVFTNIEFMGCRYPDKTMIRVAELAKGVVEKFREKRKNSLKRTFVAASDAATAKVKGQVCKGEESEPPNKIKKMTFVEPKTTSEVTASESKVNSLNQSKVCKYGGVKTFNIGTNLTIKEVEKNEEKDVLEKPEGPLGDLVLVIDNNDHNPVHTLNKTASFNRCAIKWEMNVKERPKSCNLYIKDVLVSTGVGLNAKVCKEMAAVSAIEKLRETCYGIKVMSKFFSETTVGPSHLNSQTDTTTTNELGDDNIGRKLMKLMGWEGGGLGNKGQGREEPVSAALHVRRDGLGLKSKTPSTSEFKKRAKEYIKTWMNSGSKQDLVFSSEFTADERKELHEAAVCFSLRSKSYGVEGKRQLVISRKTRPWEIVLDLKKAGGTSDKYELLYPLKT